MPAPEGATELPRAHRVWSRHFRAGGSAVRRAAEDLRPWPSFRGEELGGVLECGDSSPLFSEAGPLVKRNPLRESPPEKAAMNRRTPKGALSRRRGEFDS